MKEKGKKHLGGFEFLRSLDSPQNNQGKLEECILSKPGENKDQVSDQSPN